MAELTDVEVAVRATRAAATVLRARFGTDLDQHHKSATDFATEADLEAEQAILDVIRAQRPDDGFVGEELGEVDRGTAGRVWLVDPLCGTLNFAASTPLYSVNVALVDRGTTTVAAVAHPPSDEIYWADRAEFGILGRAGSGPATGNRIVAINADGPLDRRFVGAQLGADPRFRAQFGPRVESTTLALAWVATGQRLAYVSDGLHRGSVHFAAGLALCQAAGCIVTDFAGAPVHAGPGIIAAADLDTHTSLRELVSEHVEVLRGP